VEFGAWFLIAMNLAMAFGSIWIFMRMAPAIEVIISRNEASLQSCEDMLSALLRGKVIGDSSIIEFREALAKAERNITETEEPAILAQIADCYEEAFSGDGDSLLLAIRAIKDLGSINREAMRRADTRAKQFGHAGAWGVVFMATAAFLVGMIFLRTLDRHLAEPIQEIDAVVSAFCKGDTLRRCSLRAPAVPVRQILGHINDLLDIKCTMAAKNADDSGLMHEKLRAEGYETPDHPRL
jgi:hypothetical protein